MKIIPLLEKLTLLCLISFFVQLSTGITQDNIIPVDDKVRYGKLENGLRYYIRENAKPEEKLELRLVINAGSILEDEDQLGLAHFMEHMCFNGLEHFEKNELVDYLQSIGVKFGAHLNAYTSFDETVYMLPIPTDEPEKLEKGFQILEDWAHNALLTEEEIDKERGVVFEEYRIGLGADKRMLNNYLPKVMYNSRYAERLPIGKKDIIDNFDYDVLRRFYKDWYRPDLMAVIAVGDVEASVLEDKIISHFSGIPAALNPRERIDFEVPFHEETLIALESDKEAMFPQIQILYKDKGLPKKIITIDDYRENIIKNLFSQMINARLDEISNKPNPPYIYGYSFHGSTWARTKDAYQSVAMAAEDKILLSLETLVRENERIARFGFTKNELSRAKEEVLSRMEKYYSEREKTESRGYTYEYINHFLIQEPIPGREWEYKTTAKLLPGIQLEEVNKLISEFIHDENRVVVITGPQGESMDAIDESQVLQIFEKVQKEDIQAYEDAEVASTIMISEPVKGQITKKSYHEDLEVTTLTLSNGAVVKYKQTDFKDDELLFSAISPGGTSLFSDEEYEATYLAIPGLTEAGVNGFSKSDLSKMLAGKIVRLNPYIGSSQEGMSGSTRPKDLETLLQLVYAYFTGLNKDEESFQSFVDKQKGFMQNLLSNPQFYFQVAFSQYLNPEDPRVTGLPTDKDWEKTDYDLAIKKYRERFANAGDFTFYFIGNFEVERLEDLIEKYIASLPGNNTKEDWKDLGRRPLKGIHKKEFYKGSDPKSTVAILFTGEADYDPAEAYHIKSLGEILSIKLIEKLREEESGVYGVGANGNMSKTPYGSYRFNIGFPCGPENVDKLTSMSLAELNSILENGPSEKDLNKIRESQLLEFKENLKKNRYWLNQLRKSEFTGIDPALFLQTEKIIQELKAEDIQRTGSKYLKNNRIIGVLLPEKNED